MVSFEWVTAAPSRRSAGHPLLPPPSSAEAVQPSRGPSGTGSETALGLTLSPGSAGALCALGLSKDRD